eukprot:758045-Hanusia_phi.AAC.7
MAGTFMRVGWKFRWGGGCQGGSLRRGFCFKLGWGYLDTTHAHYRLVGVHPVTTGRKLRGGGGGCLHVGGVGLTNIEFAMGKLATVAGGSRREQGEGAGRGRGRMGDKGVENREQA